MDNEEIDKIYARYESYSKNGMMSCEQFKKSMGLLGIG